MASAPGPSVTRCVSIEKEKENFCRLCQLIMTICSDLFREILSYHIKPMDLRSTLDKNSKQLQKLKCINSHQLEILYPASQKNTQTRVEDMDMSLLYTLLRNVCDIKPHAKKWGNPPNQGDKSLGACIDRIRIMRNSLYGHLKTGSIDNVDFKNNWTDLKTNIVEIEKQLLVGNKYELKVDELLSCELSSNALQYVEEFKQLQMRIDDVERSTKRKIASKKERIDGLARSTKRHIAVKRARVGVLEKKQMSALNDVKEHLQEMEQHMIYVFQGKITELGQKMEGKLIELEQKMEGKSTAMEQKVEGKITELEQKMEGKLTAMERKVEDALERQILLPSAILTRVIETLTFGSANLSYVKSKGLLWMIDKQFCNLVQVDINGHTLERYNSSGPCCVTKDDALLYVSRPFDDDDDDDDDDDFDYDYEYGVRIKEKTTQRTFTLLKTKIFEDVICIHSSLFNGHILVLLETTKATECFYKITRYDKYGLKIQDIDIDERAQGRLNWYHNAHITENRNGDIIFSGKKEVVGIDRSGGHRFTYLHPEDETPSDICTDTYGHIIVAYHTGVHLLNEHGTFRKILLRNMSVHDFESLCLDEKQNLYVLNDQGTVKVYKFLKDE